MSWKQRVQPRLDTRDGSGWCLRFAQSVFNAPIMHESAWIAWLNATGRHTTTKRPNDTAHLVWFSHWGTYGHPARYDNWGHVAVWVPGRGYLSSPVTFSSAWGQEWFSTIGALERALPGKYVGWSEGINGLRVIERVKTDSLGGVMSYYSNKKAFRNDLMHLIRYSVPRARFNAGIEDSKGKPIVENLASSLRRAHTIGRQNRIKNDRIEGKVDALGVAIEQLSGGQIDMAAIEKAAYEGAANGAADVEAREVAELLEVSVRLDDIDDADDAAFLDADDDERPE